MLASLGLSSTRRAVKQRLRLRHITLMWTCLWRNITSETPLSSGTKDNVIYQTGHPCTSPYVGLHPNRELQVWFGFWMSFFRSLPSQMKSVSVISGIFLCIHLRWGNCPFLSALVSRPDTTLGLGPGAEHNYPTSAMFHAQRLLPHCSDTRPLFFFYSFCYFFRWNLRRELQNTKQL